MGDISQWSPQANSGYQSTQAPPDGAPENSTAVSDLNDIHRESMAAVRRQWEKKEWFDFGWTTTAPSRVNDTTFRVEDTYASEYVVDRRVRIGLPAPTWVYGVITAVTAPSGGTIDVTVLLDSGVISVSIDAVELGISREALEPPARSNLLINGNFNIWQRGVTFATAAYEPTADRWGASANTNVSRSTDVPPGIGAAISLEAQRTNGEDTLVYYYGVEFYEVGDPSPIILDRNYTLSFWVKPASSTSIDLNFYFADASGSATNRVETATATITGLTAGVWQKVQTTVQFTVEPIGSNNHMHIRFAFGANEQVNIAQAKLEIGSVATPFILPSSGDELLRCQRYFWKSFPQGTMPQPNTGSAGSRVVQANNEGRATWDIQQPVPMRTNTATNIVYNPNAEETGTARNINDGTEVAVNTPYQGDSNVIVVTVTGEAANANDRLRLHITRDAEL